MKSNTANPKVKELINTLKMLINELDDHDSETPNQSYKSNIDPHAIDVIGYAGQEYGGFPEPIMKMEDEL